MIELQFLKKNAERVYKEFAAFMEAMNKQYPLGDNYRWEMDELEYKVKKCKLSDFEWAEFEEVNDGN